MAGRPRPLPRENEEVVFGVSSVLLTRTAAFWASEEDAEAERVDLGGGRRGGVPSVEAWRQAVARDLRALGLKVRTGVFQEGTMGSVYLAEVDDPELRRSLEKEMVAYGPGRAASRPRAAAALVRALSSRPARLRAAPPRGRARGRESEGPAWGH